MGQQVELEGVAAGEVKRADLSTLVRKEASAAEVEMVESPVVAVRAARECRM